MEKYIDSLTCKTKIPEKLQKINLSLSSGGTAGVYHAGVCAYLISLIKQKKMSIYKIYAASAGAAAGVILVYSLFYHSFSIDNFMTLWHTDFFEETKKENGYTTNAYRNILQKILPEDIHEKCDNILNISIHVIENAKIVFKTINQFKSKEHLLDVIHISMSVPFITIPEAIKTYHCPFSNTNYWAFDGWVVSPIKKKDNMYPVVTVDLRKYNYSLYKKMRLCESSYDFMANDGIEDAHKVFFQEIPVNSLFIVYPREKKKEKIKEKMEEK